MLRDSFEVIKEQLENAMDKVNKQQERVDKIINTEKEFVTNYLTKKGLQKDSAKFEAEVASYMTTFEEEDAVFKKQYETLRSLQYKYGKIKKSYNNHIKNQKTTAQNEDNER